MTPMIDVVFQLLIYFLVTFTTPDVLAHLDISRPAPDPSQTEQRTPPKMIRVNIYSEGGREEGFSLNGRAVSRAELTTILNRLAWLLTNDSNAGPKWLISLFAAGIGETSMHPTERLVTRVLVTVRSSPYGMPSLGLHR